MLEEKKCASCGETKKAEEFTKSKKDKSGLKPYCKPCMNEKNKEYRKDEKTKYLIAIYYRIPSFKQSVNEGLRTITLRRKTN